VCCLRFLPSFPRLALFLLMPRVDADDPHNPLAADDLAVAADFLDRSSDFHGPCPYLYR
jgi:hypothetical protein